MPASAPSFTFSSETDMLVAKCLAEVRAMANLDDDPVLRPLPPPLPAAARRRRDAAPPEASVEVASHVAIPLPAPSAARAFASALPTLVTRRPRVLPRERRVSSRFALVLCALVALVSAVLAVVRSPLGKRPAVARAVQITTGVAHGAAATTLDVLRFGER